MPTGCAAAALMLALCAICVEMIQPARANAASATPCVDVQIGQTFAYGCINKELRQIVDGTHAMIAVPDVRADSPPVASGLFNRAAVRERLGNAFGHSVVPQRPGLPGPAFESLVR